VSITEVTVDVLLLQPMATTLVLLAVWALY